MLIFSNDFQVLDSNFKKILLLKIKKNNNKCQINIISNILIRNRKGNQPKHFIKIYKESNLFKKKEEISFQIKIQSIRNTNYSKLKIYKKE